MKVLFSILVACGMSLSLSAQQCIELAWTGGAAGDGVKWVQAEMTQNGEIVTITYDWKNGSMTGRVQEDGSLKGTWIQDGSDGGQFQFSIPEGDEAMGWWNKSSDPSTKFDMLVRLCDE